MDTIGKLSSIRKEHEVEWTIEDFSTLSMEEDKRYHSPVFYFANASWYLRIYPNCGKQYMSIGYIGVHLMRKSSGLPVSLDYTLILKNMDEKRDEHHSYVFKKPECGYGWCKIIKRSEFLKRRSELGMPDAVTVICTMKYLESTNDASQTVTAKCSYCEKPCETETISFHEGKCLDKPIKCPECSDVTKLRDWYDHDCQKSRAEGKTKTAECSHCKKPCEAESISIHEGKCLDKPIKCPECCDVIHLRDWYDHECQKSRSEASEKVLQDWKAVMLDGVLSDILIKVKEEEFRLHRTVLAARNSYFHSMFTCDMKEKNAGIVSIEDCEPDIFRTFVLFIYTGKVDKLSPENVCELYEVADKYQEDQLKKQCFEFMKKTLSEDTFCDFIVLALKYDERELFEKAVEFFTFKPNKIVRSVKWQNFMGKYPTQANELLIKLVDRHVK